MSSISASSSTSRIFMKTGLLDCGSIACNRLRRAHVGANAPRPLPEPASTTDGVSVPDQVPASARQIHHTSECRKRQGETGKDARVPRLRSRYLIERWHAPGDQPRLDGLAQCIDLLDPKYGQDPQIQDSDADPAGGEVDDFPCQTDRCGSGVLQCQRHSACGTARDKRADRRTN